MFKWPHLCLDQVVSLSADVFEEAHDVHTVFFFDLLQHAVQHNVSARSANTGTAITCNRTGNSSNSKIQGYSFPIKFFRGNILYRTSTPVDYNPGDFPNSVTELMPHLWYDYKNKHVNVFWTMSNPNTLKASSA